jgi:hypothetical protein
MARIDIGKFRQEIVDSVGGKLDEKAFNAARVAFADYKEDLLRRFDESEVTQEILNGPDSEDLSGATDGYGNLYTFIGFEDSEDAGRESIAELRNTLEFGTKLLKTPTTRNGKTLTWQFAVYVPTEKDLNTATPMPWETGLSWLRSIENGTLNNLNHYIYRRYIPKSRSTAGIQSKVEYQAIAFRPVSYVSDMLREFRELFSR